METKEILSKTDHTFLSQTSTWEDIKNICDDGMKYGVASVCIPPCFVKRAAEYVCGKVKICTVIGFPNGYNTTAAKCFEAADAVACGAEELDMVINLGMVKEKRFGDILDEINAVKKACAGKLLKVIVETCLLSEEEKLKMCEIVSASDAEYIKTSTGFSKWGATRADVALFVNNATGGTLVKAAGGICTLAEAEGFIKLGASRLGTSRVIRNVKQTEVK